MKITHHFKINKLTFDRRTVTELQHRIRVPLKCYTITAFKLNEDHTFEFKKTNRKLMSGNKVLITDPLVHHGSYFKEEFDENSYKVTINIHD